MFVIKKSINGQYYFVIKANNGQVLATSETYITKQSCKNGIAAVKSAASGETEDETGEKFYSY